MAKKKIRSKYTSKGQRNNVARSTINGVRQDRDEVYKFVRQVNAWAKGVPVKVTIENPNPNETNKRFIRVPASQVYGDWKRTIDIYRKNANA